jgi:hypothetical protein
MRCLFVLIFQSRPVAPRHNGGIISHHLKLSRTNSACTEITYVIIITSLKFGTTFEGPLFTLEKQNPFLSEWLSTHYKSCFLSQWLLFLASAVSSSYILLLYCLANCSFDCCSVCVYVFFHTLLACFSLTSFLEELDASIPTHVLCPFVLCIFYWNHLQFYSTS